MADWETPELTAALADVTIAPNGVTSPTGPPKNEEALKRAHDAGWVQPKAHNYDSKAPVTTLNGGGVEVQTDAAPAAEGEAETDAVPVSRYGKSTWSHDAVKYEWEEAFGEVGPRSEKLEKDLFYAEHINRVGSKLMK